MLLKKKRFLFAFAILFTVIFFSCSQNDEKATGDSLAYVEMPKRKLTRQQQFKSFRLDTLFSLLHKTGAFNGNVLVAQNDTIIFQKSYGYADKENKTMLHDSSSFQL